MSDTSSNCECEFQTVKGTLKVLKVLLKVLIVSQTIGIFPESTFSTLIYIKLIELNYYVVVELIVDR